MEKITITKSYPAEFIANTASVIGGSGHFDRPEGLSDTEFVGLYFSRLVNNEEKRLAEMYKNLAVQGMKDQIEAQIAPLVNQLPEVIIE